MTQKAPVTENQLKLFQNVIDRTFSNAVELYDSMPKYVFGRGAVFRDTELPVEKHIIERRFTHPVKANGRTTVQEFYLRLSPATIIRYKDGKPERFFVYPSYREMLVEDAIRKIAVDGGGMRKDGGVGARFTVRHIRKILSEAGHQMKHDAVVEAIGVLNKCHLEYGYIEIDGKTRVSGRSSFFPEIYIKTSSDVGSDVQSVVLFHDLVNRSIRNKAYRNYDFDTCIACSSGVSNYLHKRLSQRFVQASPENAYRFKFSEFDRTCGLTETQPNKVRLRMVQDALDELIKLNSVASYEEEAVLDAKDRRKRTDTIFTVRVTDKFVDDAIKVNSLSRLLRDESSGNGEETH